MTTLVVVDSSAIVSIFRGESDAADLFERAMSYERRVISASPWLECAMVCEGKIEQGGGERFDRIVGALNLEVSPFSPAQAVIARSAFKRYGKGRQAKASLSFGDCSPMLLQKTSALRCCSRAMTSPKPTFPRPE